jgi:hypothetical protein
MWFRPLKPNPYFIEIRIGSRDEAVALEEVD